jgi:hypothetical protein
MRKATPLLYVAGGAAMIFALCADTCETSTEFPGFVKEICNDNVDNDSDGTVDCLDSDCDQACQITLVTNLPGAIAGDTLVLSGTAHNATSINVTVRPNGEADPVVVVGDTWRTVARKLVSAGQYIFTVTATGAQGKTVTDTTTVLK